MSIVRLGPIAGVALSAVACTDALAPSSATSSISADVSFTVTSITGPTNAGTCGTYVVAYTGPGADSASTPIPLASPAPGEGCGGSD
jgi:hypothetical protein